MKEIMQGAMIEPSKEKANDRSSTTKAHRGPPGVIDVRTDWNSLIVRSALWTRVGLSLAETARRVSTVWMAC